MPSIPQPPSTVSQAGELAAIVHQNPDAWFAYLQQCQNYMNDSQRTVAHLESIVAYQKDELNQALETVGRLKLEKQQLTAAATPALFTPPTASLNTAPTTETPPDNATKPAETATLPCPRSPIRSERLPDPDKFDGTRGDLRRFVAQIYGKLQTNEDRFPTAKARLTYVAGRLSGKAYELLLPKTLYGIPQFADYPALLEYLEIAFGDPDRVQNAQNKLYQLRQRNVDFSAYFAEFQRLSLEGEMHEEALTPLLYQGISRELQDMLLHSPAPSRSFRTFARHLQELDNRYRQHQQQAARINRGLVTPKTVNPATSSAPRVPPLSTTELYRRTAPPYPAAASPTPGGDPMDLSVQRNTRRERGECFRCGSKDHRIASCPRPDTRFRATQLRTGRSNRSPSPDPPRSLSPLPSPSVNDTSLE